jgi:signal transduction histidine kinase
MQQESGQYLPNPRDVPGTNRSFRVGRQVSPMRESEGSPTLVLDFPHELRTALAIITLIIGNLDLLYERLGDDERRKMIRKIRKHTEKLNALVLDAMECASDPSRCST